MTAIFKNQCEGREYIFHRTILNDEVVYFVTFNLDGQRTSIKISNKRTGKWEAQPAPGTGIVNQVEELIYIVSEKEKFAN